MRSLNNALSRLEVHIILFAPAGDPSSQSSDTLMSRQRIYAPPRVLVFGVRCGPAGVAVDARWFSVCAPCLANWGGGGLSRFGLLLGGWVFCVWGGGGLSRFGLLRGGWMFCMWGGGGGCRGLACRLVAGSLGWCAVFSGSALRVSHGRSPQRSKEKAERPGDGCPCVGAEETCGVAAMLHGGLVLIAFQSVTPVRASPNTAVN